MFVWVKENLMQVLYGSINLITLINIYLKKKYMKHLKLFEELHNLSKDRKWPII
jgi:hypothetical protein